MDDESVFSVILIRRLRKCIFQSDDQHREKKFVWRLSDGDSAEATPKEFQKLFQ